jgi:hypothetical protein
VQLTRGDAGKHPAPEEPVHEDVTPLQVTEPAAALQLVPLHDLATPSNGEAQFVDAVQLNTGDGGGGGGLPLMFSDVVLICGSFAVTAQPPLTISITIHSNVYARILCSFDPVLKGATHRLTYMTCSWDLCIGEARTVDAPEVLLGAASLEVLARR